MKSQLPDSGVYDWPLILFQMVYPFTTWVMKSKKVINNYRKMTKKSKNTNFLHKIFMKNVQVLRENAENTNFYGEHPKNANVARKNGKFV